VWFKKGRIKTTPRAPPLKQSLTQLSSASNVQERDRSCLNNALGSTFMPPSPLLRTLHFFAQS
jgi:hypothetical protein